MAYAPATKAQPLESWGRYHRRYVLSSPDPRTTRPRDSEGHLPRCGCDRQRRLGRTVGDALSGHPLLAVQDQGVRYISGPFGLSNYRSLGIPEGTKYFNAGVLVLDLEKWRHEHISDAVVQYIKDHSDHIRFHDQDGLNAVLWNRWGWLDPRWNQMPQLLQISQLEESPFDRPTHERAARHPYITHFASSDKPWRFRCRHPATGDFLSALATTDYRNFRPSQWRDRWADVVHAARSRLVRLREGLAR